MLILISEAEQQNLIIASGNDEEEMATLELIPENEDQQLPKKNSKTVMHSKNNEKWFLRNPTLPKISTFWLGQKGCAYFGCAYYEWGQYTP